MINRIPWNFDSLFQPPKTHPAPGFDEPGVRSLYFDGPAWKSKPTRVFAWLGLPERAKHEKVPAMVLVHGGGGTAFVHWVRLWNQRGYAAIAMDTCGCTAGGEHANRPRHDQGGPAGWGGFDQIDDPVADQWPFHAVADVILANSLLRSLPEVDADRVGITGISWGGYLTCLTAAVDARFKFAAPVYGCGFLGEDSGWLDTFAEMGPKKSKRWLNLWDPSHFLPHISMPMLWVNGTNDTHYRLGSYQKSYRLPGTFRTLCIRVNMPHGHTEGENPEEIRAFADQVLLGKTPLTQVGPTVRDQSTVRIAFTGQAQVQKAEFNFTRDRGPWPERQWESVLVPIEPRATILSASIPTGAAACFFNLIDSGNLLVSSEHLEL